MIAVPANTQDNVKILLLSKGEKPTLKSKGGGSIALWLLGIFVTNTKHLWTPNA